MDDHRDDIAVPKADRRAADHSPGAGRASRFPLVMAIGGIVLGLGGIGLAAWSHLEGQREVLRLASEVAQLRVSLDLYARGDDPVAPASAVDEARLTDLADRLSVLEEGLAAGVPAGLPASAPSAAASVESDGDCLPPGMRLLVAAGDNYPICGQAASVEISQVDNGFIVLADGTAVASGGTMALPGSACTIGVTSGGDEGTTGFAEIRVTC